MEGEPFIREPLIDSVKGDPFIVDLQPALGMFGCLGDLIDTDGTIVNKGDINERGMVNTSAEGVGLDGSGGRRHRSSPWRRWMKAFSLLSFYPFCDTLFLMATPTGRQPRVQKWH